MNRPAVRPAPAPAAVAATLLLPLAALRLAAAADAQRVFAFGRELHWDCLFKQLYGIPCPACGMTRSVLLTLQGQLGSAWQLNPAGIIFVLGILTFGAAMIYVSLRPRALEAGTLRRRAGVGAGVFGGLFVAAILLHWVAQILKS